MKLYVFEFGESKQVYEVGGRIYVEVVFKDGRRVDLSAREVDGQVDIRCWGNTPANLGNSMQGGLSCTIRHQPQTHDPVSLRRLNIPDGHEVQGTISLDDDLMDDVASGDKVSTVRDGRRSYYRLGYNTIQSTKGRRCVVYIDKIYWTTVDGYLADKEADDLPDGMFLDALRAYYPDIAGIDPVTILEWRFIEKLAPLPTLLKAERIE